MCVNETGLGRSLLVQRMMKKGVQMVCNAKVERVDKYSKDGKEYCINNADTLVFAAGYKINSQMEEC